MVSSVKPPIDIPALTGLRFIAAFIVFVFHIHIRAPLSENEFAANLFSQGAVGMTVFFMLSGFILSHRYSGKNFSDKDFIRARVGRIYPVYIASFIFALPMLYFQLDELRFGFVSGLVQVLVIFATTILMIQAWIPMLFSYVNNNANWSLSAEAFFYGIFLLISARVSSLSRRGLISLSLLCFALSVISPLSYYAFDNRPTHGLQIFYAMPIFRISEFIIGMTTYHLMLKSSSLSVSSGKILLGLLIVTIVYLATIGPKLPIFVGHNWLLIPTVSMALIAFTNGTTIFAKFSKSKLMVYLGRISYCFYCFQVHVLTFLMFLMPNYRDYAWAFFAISLALLIGVSSFFFHFLEEPARKFVKHKFLFEKPAAVQA